MSAAFRFNDTRGETEWGKTIRTELKRIEQKKKIVLDPFQSTPYSSAPLTRRGQQKNVVRCPSG